MVASDAVTCVVPRSRGLLDDIATRDTSGLKASAHPSGPYVVLTSHSAAADRLMRELVQQYGEVTWRGGRWCIRKPQLRLPGI